MEIVLLADALEGLRTLEPENVHTCVTSPPYYNLRDYGVAGQIGNEDTPEEFVEKLVEVFREVRRVLRPDGTLWVNIGDSYATRSGPQPPTNTRNSCGHTAKRTPSGYKYKDLIGIPWLLALAMGSVQNANPMESSVTLNVSYILIEVDGTTLVELDKINPTFKVNGVDLLQKVREMT